MTEEKRGLTSSLFKGVTRKSVEALARSFGINPNDRSWVTMDVGASLAGVSLKVATDFFRVVPEVALHLENDDLKQWAEVGRRVALDNADEADTFFHRSPEVLLQVPPALRSQLVTLCAKQIVLSPSTALNTFYSAPQTIESLGTSDASLKLFNIAVAVANRSVKHSTEVLAAAPKALNSLKELELSVQPPNSLLTPRALELAENFANRTGATAAEFLSALGEGLRFIKSSAEADSLYDQTTTFLERGGATALQYFRAAKSVMEQSDTASFDKWNFVTKRVADEGNALVYDFLKLTPKVMAALSANQRRIIGAKQRTPEHSLAIIKSVLEMTEELADDSVYVALECFKSAPRALAAASLEQFQAWARAGAGMHRTDRRRAQAYYALESKSSQDSLRAARGGLALEAVSHLLRLYVEGLTGREMAIAPLGAVPDESRINDGLTIHLPAMIAEFGSLEDDFRLYKVLAAHAAGQVEFGTRDIGTPELRAALKVVDDFFTEQQDARPHTVDSDEIEIPEESILRQRFRPDLSDEHFDAADFKLTLTRFPNPGLAARIFTTLENGRIDFLLRQTYRGIRRDLNFVRARLLDNRPPITSLPMDQMLYELLFQITLCGGVVDPVARKAYGDVIGEFHRIVEECLHQENASVADTVIATKHVYALLQSPRTEENAEAESDDKQDSDKDDSNKDQENQGNQQQQQTLEQQQRQSNPFTQWSEETDETLADETETLSEMLQAERPEQDLQEGDQAFFYDEWDRELGDYRAKWCRVIQRENRRGMRDFVEQVRARYSGVISSIRNQFQLLRPESLRKIKGELDGEEYDLQAVIDRHVDLRTNGRPSDRIYIRRIRRERDVAVSFLLDMSSSTARTITRHPNQPYTRPGQKIIDIEKQGLVLMSEALEAVGDAYSISGFSSEGRRNVKYFTVKEFGEKYSPEVERRIGGITYHNNTRLGAAIRHCAAQLEKQPARTKLLIILSDGRPYDHDYGDSRYAREDTKMALRHSKTQGITPFCVTIDRDSETELKDLYGEVGYTIIDDVMSLPERMPGIYRRLTT